MSGMPPTMEFNRPLGKLPEYKQGKRSAGELKKLSKNIQKTRAARDAAGKPKEMLALPSAEKANKQPALTGGAGNSGALTSGGNAAPISGALFGSYVNPNPYARKYSQTETAKPALREPTREDHLRVLGLGPSASNAQIIAARDKALKAYHPDRLTNPRTKQPYTKETKREHARKLSNINSAFSSLGIKQ